MVTLITVGLLVWCGIDGMRWSELALLAMVLVRGECGAYLHARHDRQIVACADALRSLAAATTTTATALENRLAALRTAQRHATLPTDWMASGSTSKQ